MITSFYVGILEVILSSALRCKGESANCKIVQAVAISVLLLTLSFIHEYMYIYFSVLYIISRGNISFIKHTIIIA